MQNSHNGQTANQWSHNFNLSGVKGIGEGSFKTAPEGFYTATIVSTEPNHERGSIEFVVEINDGEFKGCKCEKGIKLPTTNDGADGRPKNQFIWTSLFQSLGYDQATIESGNFQPNPAQWVNAPVFIYWKNGNKETQTWRELLFMSKDAWTVKKAKFDQQNNVPQHSTNTVTQTAPVNAAPQAPQMNSLPQAPQAQMGNAIPQAVPNNGGSGFGGMNTNALMNSLNNR